MKDIEKYYDNTESNKPRKNVQYFIEKIQSKPGKAIELGCGAGNDTWYLIENDWNVIGIDREDVEERVSKRLSRKKVRKFTFQKQEFENITLEENNLIVANNSLSFCDKDEFKKLWNKIKRSILPNRIFCW